MPPTGGDQTADRGSPGIALSSYACVCLSARVGNGADANSRENESLIIDSFGWGAALFSKSCFNLRDGLYAIKPSVVARRVIYIGASVSVALRVAGKSWHNGLSSGGGLDYSLARCTAANGNQSLLDRGAEA